MIKFGIEILQCTKVHVYLRHWAINVASEILTKSLIHFT
jgi:hypothetical protein